jgi:hypothetical protein
VTTPTHRSSSRTAGRTARWNASLVLAAAIPVLYLAVFGAFLARTGDSDWDQILSFHELSLWNGELSGLAKQWNPLMRGGMSLAGDPQVPVFSLSMILARVMHPAAAIKIAVLFFLAAGALGAWLLARDLGFSRRAAVLAASLFAGNGYIVSRFSHGHVVFLGTLGLPLWLWAARRSVRAAGEPAGSANRRLLALALAGGAFFALSTDGAPIAILLLLVWVGLDGAILSWQRRSLRPLVFFGASLLVAAALDAVYFFPLAANAVVFPRLRPPVFINPLVFAWFFLLPVRGKLIPAPANGHEMSVYIGPVLAWLLVKYRGEIARAFPNEDRQRFLVVSAAMFVLGLGAWRALSSWLPPGPFDLLHRLPGFGAIGIPSRFWGYLALPLALACAAALDFVQGETTPARPRLALWAGVFLSVLGFQVSSILPPFVSENGRMIVEEKSVPPAIRTILNVHGPRVSQAAELFPDTGLLEAYDAHEYIQGIIREGSELVVAASTPAGKSVPVQASWEGWSRIRLAFPSGAPNGTEILLNQNSHPRWGFAGGLATSDRHGNLRAVLTRDAAPGERLEVSFHDPASAMGERVSFWSALVAAAAALALAVFAFARRLARRREASRAGGGALPVPESPGLLR